MLTDVAPRSTHKTFGDWGEFLRSIYISPWLAFAGSTVCILSDHPKKYSIKSLERQRREEIEEDQTINVAINSDIPGNERWESVLANAGNKRAIGQKNPLPKTPLAKNPPDKTPPDKTFFSEIL